MNHDDRRVLARAIRQRQIAAHRFIAALVAHRLRFWRSSSQRQSECQNSQRQHGQKNVAFHVRILQRKRLRNFSASRSPKPPPVIGRLSWPASAVRPTKRARHRYVFSRPRPSTLSARRRLDRPDTYAAPKASRLPDSSLSHTSRTLLYSCPPAV